MIDIKDVRGLSVHRYAPEMNELVMRNGKRYKCPQIFDIEQAINHVNKKGNGRR